MTSVAQYFDITKPAPVRLAMMRKAFAEHDSKYPHCPEAAKPKSWRDIRRTTHKGLSNHIGSMNQGFNTTGGYKTPVWYCHTGQQFRDERFADECEGGRDYTGWLTNHDGATYKDGSGLARGIIGRLTHGRFIAGYQWGDNGERVYFPDVFDNEREAACMADEHARVFAEAEREYSEKYDTANTLQGEIEENLQCLRECIALRHKTQMVYLRDEIANLLHTIRDKREELQRDYAEFI